MTSETTIRVADYYAIVNAGQLEQMISDYKMNVTHETNE